MKTRLMLAALLLASTATPALAIDMTYVDKTVKPGDDFNLYANGAWTKATEIPADRASTGVGYEVFQLSEQRNAKLFADLAAGNPAAGSDARKIADYYAAYKDTAGIEARGLAPIQPELAAINAIADKHALSAMLGANMRADTDPLNATNFWTENLFGLFVTQALTKPDQTVPYLLQGGIGMPDRDYYLSTDPSMAAKRDAYRAYVADLLTLAGIPDAKAKAEAIYALEMKIAAVHADREASGDMGKGNNPWTRADFDTKAPGIDWTAFWQAAGLPNQQDFIVWHPAATTGLSALVASEPLEAWKAWLTFHRINTAASVLPKAIDDRRFAFYGTTLSGTPQQRTRDKRAIAATNNALGDAIGKLYVDRYFPASSRADVQAMVANIKAAFDKRVASLGWMAPATKAEARRKIATMRVGVGYPDNWRDYASLDVRADDPLGNLRRAQLFEYRWQLAKIGQPRDPGEWWMTPQTVNAVNLPVQNALNFPAAILEAPYYDPKADAAENYGAIGAVIGHEISHSFDDSGALFDAQGTLRNWWTKEDFAHFEQQGAALAAQYDAYEPFPGVHLRGKQELSENIADVAGLAAAHDAYLASLGGKPAPVVDGLTGDQRFFLAFAQAWRQKTRDEALRQQIVTDGHAPAQYRAETVRNIDAWYPAFNVKPGEKLYLAPDGRVQVWK